MMATVVGVVGLPVGISMSAVSTIFVMSTMVVFFLWFLLIMLSVVSLVDVNLAEEFGN